MSTARTWPKPSPRRPSESWRPYYRATVATDRARLAEIEALRNGAAPPPRDDLRAAFAKAIVRDPDVFRAALEISNCLALPQDVFARPSMTERILAAAAEANGSAPRGPTRDQVIKILASAR